MRRGPVECGVGRLQVRLRSVGVIPPEPGRGPGGGDRDVVDGQVRWDRGEHALELVRPVREQDRDVARGEDLGRVIPVLRLDTAAQRVDRPAVLAVPAGRAAQQDGNLVRHLPPQVGEEKFPQQRVVAVPGPLAVERADEAVLPAEAVEAAGAVGGACERVRELAGQVLDDARAQQEDAGLRILPGEHLVAQVVGDDGVVTRRCR